MCGIAGIFSYHYAAPGINRDELHTIRDSMAARGPDGKGEWYSVDDRMALGHRRLSIIDLSSRAAQPMASEDGSVVVSFNGEIYNYQSLRKELKQKGHKFHSQSDTEVLLRLYVEKGAEMVHDLRGMFAFALWDVKKKALLLARDPYGIKPLYYADDGWTLRVASQVKALLAGGKVSRQPEPAGVVGFFLFGSVPEPFTTYREIRAVPAGSYLWVDSTGPTKPTQYFSVAKVWANFSEETVTDDVQRRQQIRAALRDSVKHHMIADVPVGAFLSGGIDSGSIVGLMSELTEDTHQLKTICLAFEEFKGLQDDESPLAATVAKHYGTSHVTRLVTEKEFRHDLPMIFDAMDQPTIDGLNSWFVAKAANESGLKVAVSGVGGDELFGSYPSFRDIPNWVGRLWLPSRIPGLGVFAEQAKTVFAPLFDYLNPKAAGMLRYGGSYPGAYLLKRGLFLPAELSRIIDPEVVKEGLRRLQPVNHINQSLRGCGRSMIPFARVAALESSLYLRNQLLRDTDWAAMAHSVEVRLPLVDADLLKKLVSPLSTKPQLRGKRLLATSPTRELPSEVVNRDKSGFTTPIQKWQLRDRRTRAWQRKPMLLDKRCPWARRWAAVVMDGL